MNILKNIDDIITMNSNHYTILIIKSLLFLILFRLLNKIIVLLCAKRVKTSRKAFILNKNVSIIINIITLITLFVVWEPYLKNIITVISFVSAGVTIAIREVIVNLFAGIFINTKKPFKLEDRICIDGVIGDVVVINALSFKILEVKDRENGEQSSGLIINIPNSFVFSHSLKNYNTAFKYIWEEMTVKIPLDADVEKNKKEILNIVENNEIVASIPKKMDKEIHDASLDYRIYYNHLEPIIYTKIVDNHIELTARFLVHPKKSRIVEDDIWTKILQKYKNKKIDLYKA